ncbi:AraC family transcriptional regulator [Dyella soli]|uniref:AraC family transcriptional regulator n=1 Tax=Dyella soli TaxID=522319 RepID=A0A4R0YQV3_9GAMM|nr:AraC family transcriptional regulator [Dyella soli]TCI08855.1 AraC family transcriptional regulator [Dyella soli]
MDSLSHLVHMLSPTGTVDLLCRYVGAWALDNGPAPPGHVPYHVVLRGRARLRSGQQTLELAAGDVLMFPHGARHTLVSAVDADDLAPPPTPSETQHFNGVVTEVEQQGEGEPYDMLCGNFVLGDAGSALMRSLPEVVRVVAGPRTGLIALIEMMRAETMEPRPGGAAVVSELSTALFALVLRSLVSEQALGTGVLALMADPRLSRAVEAVLRDPAQHWTLAGMAAQALMSRATFARQFAQTGGITPMEWVADVRMELAARLLTRENLTAGQVAERCGYASEAAFGRAFREHVGETPGAFRRQQRQRREAAMAAGSA